MINIINTYTELFAFMEKEEHWFNILAVVYNRSALYLDVELNYHRKKLLSYAEELGLKHVFLLEESGGSCRSRLPKLKELAEFYENHTRNGACPPLIVLRLDRLSRNFQDQGPIIELIHQKALEIHFVEDRTTYSAHSAKSNFSALSMLRETLNKFMLPLD